VFIKEIELFQALGSDFMGQVSEAARERELPAGQVIFNQGQSAEKLYILVEGGVDLSIEQEGSCANTLPAFSANAAALARNKPRSPTEDFPTISPAPSLLLTKVSNGILTGCQKQEAARRDGFRKVFAFAGCATRLSFSEACRRMRQKRARRTGRQGQSSGRNSIRTAIPVPGILFGSSASVFPGKELLRRR